MWTLLQIQPQGCIQTCMIYIYIYFYGELVFCQKWPLEWIPYFKVKYLQQLICFTKIPSKFCCCMATVQWLKQHVIKMNFQTSFLFEIWRKYKNVIENRNVVSASLSVCPYCPLVCYSVFFLFRFSFFFLLFLSSEHISLEIVAKKNYLENLGYFIYKSMFSSVTRVDHGWNGTGWAEVKT